MSKIGFPFTNDFGQLESKTDFNDEYVIRLMAVDLSGASHASFVGVFVDGEEKVGHFSISQTEVDIPLYGFPLSISRTYDSRDKEPGDFG